MAVTLAVHRCRLESLRILYPKEAGRDLIVLRDGFLTILGLKALL